MAKVGQWQRVVGRTACVLTQLIALVGCAGGQTGEDSFFTSCFARPTPISIDTISPLGFSASQILAYAAGEHESTATWHEFADLPAGSQAVSGATSPGDGEKDVAFTIHYSDGRARFVHQWPMYADIPAEQCDDWLEIDVTASLATSDGALDESFDTTLFALSARQAEWWANLSDVHGSLGVTSTEPPVSAGLWLRGSVTPEGSVGSALGGFSYHDATTTISADWPAGPPCDGTNVPLNARLPQFSANDALELINALPAMPLWQGFLPGVEIETEANLMLRVSPRGPTACAHTWGFSNYGKPFEWERSTLALLAQLNATTDDGSINIQLPVKIEAWPDAEGGLSSVTLTMDSPLDTGVSPSDLDAQHSFVDADSSSYDAISCTLESTFKRDQSGTRAQGRLIVWGHTGASCVQNVSYPGCLADEIEALYWYPSQP